MLLFHQGSLLYYAFLPLSWKSSGSSDKGLLTLLPDGLIGLTCFIVPVFLIYLLAKRNTPLRWLLLSASVFSAGVGSMYLISIIIVWVPVSTDVTAGIKTLTAIAALCTIMAFGLTVKGFLTIPTRAELEEKNQKLRESEAKFRGIFESDVAGIAIFNKHGYFTEANERFAQILGYSRREMAEGNLHWTDPTTPDYKEVDGQAWQAMQTAGRMTPYEKEVTRKDRTRISVLAGGTIIDQQTGVAFVLDNSAHKRAMQELQSAEERFKLLTQATNDVVWDADLTTGKLWWNENYKKQFGYEEADADSAVSWYDRVHPDDLERVATTMQEAELDGHQQWSSEYRFRKANGEYAHILDRGYLLRDPAGHAVRAIGSMVDVTALKRAQEELEEKAVTLQQFNTELEERQSALRESLAKFSAVFDSNMIGICFLNFNDNITDANQVFLKTLGWTREDLQNGNLNWMAMTPPEYRDLDVHSKRELAEKGVNTPYEKEFNHKNGTRIPVLVGNAVLGDFDNLCVGFSLDITHRKRAEQRLRRTMQELKKRNFELDNYVYKVSHDLRAPLSSILGLINVFRLENDPAKTDFYVDLIENRAKKLDNFIQSILNHSRTNSTEIQMGAIDFRRIIRESFEELRYMPQSESMQLILEVNQSTQFVSDPLKVSIILKNFLSNALKYTHPYKPSHFVKFTIEATEHNASITVEDNGIGIDPQYLPRIFDMFFRATEKSDGSGLGLYIVKQTIEKLGGNISVNSQLGEGTSFYITLPNLLEHAPENSGELASVKK